MNVIVRLCFVNFDDFHNCHAIVLGDAIVLEEHPRAAKGRSHRNPSEDRGRDDDLGVTVYTHYTAGHQR